LKGLIPGFLKNRRGDIKKILEALEKDDYGMIQRLGHKMKGTCPDYGFDAVAAIGRSIEAAAKAGNSDEIRRRTRELSSYLDRVDVVYQ